MTPLNPDQFLDFLQQDLAIPSASVSVAMHQLEGQSLHLLPMVLWQYGLVTLDQLDAIFSWMETT